MGSVSEGLCFRVVLGAFCTPAVKKVEGNSVLPSVLASWQCTQSLSIKLDRVVKGRGINFCHHAESILVV